MFNNMAEGKTFHVLTDSQYSELLHRLSVIEQQTKPRDELINQSAAAARIGVSKATINRWLKSGVLTPHTVKGSKTPRISLNELISVSSKYV